MSILPFFPFERTLDRAFRDFDVPYFGPLDPARAFNLGSTLGEVVNNKDKFAVGVDVSQFRPEELKVNVHGDKLVIEGHHEEKSDVNGSIQRSFVRKYTLPKDANLEALRSHLSKDGKLSVEAPKKAVEGPQTRAIPIQHHP